MFARPCPKEGGLYRIRWASAITYLAIPKISSVPFHAIVLKRQCLTAIDPTDTMQSNYTREIADEIVEQTQGALKWIKQQF